MRTLSLISTAVLLMTSLQVSAATADQSWSCVRDERATALRSKNSRINESPITGLQIKIKDAKLIDGEITGWENDAWKFTEPSPSGRNDPTYEAVLENKRSSGDTVVISVNSDGWDHYNYTVRLNTRTGLATVDEAIQEDCRNPASGVAVLNCQRSQ